MRVLIVGGVAGGMSAAARLRRLDERAEIVVYEAGEHVSFANCGLPYYIGDVITDRSALLLQTPESLGARFNLDVRVRTRVMSIDRTAKTVELLTKDGQSYSDHYDKLIISTGATPNIANIPGIERALVLRDVTDADTMKKATEAAKTVAILGGGFIGVELAENFAKRGLETTIVQRGNQLLPVFDLEIVEPLQAKLVSNGVSIRLGSAATAVTATSVVLADGSEIPADVVITATGVVPDVKLAEAAGLSLGNSGGILVDDRQQTSDPNIFAVGDATEKHLVLRNQTGLIPLANIANRHGRLVADVIAGLEVQARPSQSTAIIGAFGTVVAGTGLTERQVKAMKLPHEIVHVHPGSHAGYFPGAKRVSLKLIFEPVTGKILGAQGVGEDGVDKRIDVLATAMFAGLAASDLMDLELSYAPEFGSAKDPVNMLGYLADNLLSGRTPNVQWNEINGETFILDVRTKSENARESIPGSTLIPVDELRTRLDELPKNRQIVVHCAVGQRGHTATQILRQNGFDAVNLDGGFVTWRAGQDALARLN